MKIGFLGAGAMGGAILSGALETGVVKAENVYVYDLSEAIKEKLKYVSQKPANKSFGWKQITAIAASFAVPVLIWLLVEIFKADVKESREFFIMLAVCSVGFPLLSGMGIIITILMIGCYGLCYGIVKKSIKLMLLLWLTAVPAGLIFIGYYLEYRMRK